MKPRFATIILLALIISACSSATQVLSPTESLQLTIEPTFTSLPLTSTPEPENIPTFTQTNETNSGMEIPIPDWEGIPVMPGAIKGEIAGFGYIYWVDATAEEIEMFYSDQMHLTNYSLVKQANVLSWYGRGILLQFRRESSSEFVDIVLYANTDDDSLMVSIEKYIYHP